MNSLDHATPKGWKMALLLSLLCLSTLPNSVEGHGYLMSPRSRNYVASASQDGKWSGGGASDPMVDSNVQSLNRGGLCGLSPATGNYATPLNALGGPMPLNTQATYEQGDIIDVEVVLTAHHNGHFAFKACPLASHGDIPTQECFDSYPLEFVSDELYGVAKDTNYADRAYIVPAGDSQTAGQPSGKYYKYKYRLPPMLNGPVVLLQWHYVTGNSCFDEGYRAYGQYPFPWGQPNLSDCSLPLNGCGDGAPEQFWNCAEVAILPTPGAMETVPPPAGPTTLPCSGPVAPTTYAPVAPVATPPPPPPPPPPPQPGLRCGSTWSDANTKCGVVCPTGNSTVCPTGELCYADVASEICQSPAPQPVPQPVQAPTTAPTLNENFCGIDWFDANGKCATACPGGVDAECPSGESCFAGCTDCGGTTAPVAPPTLRPPTLPPTPRPPTEPTALPPTEDAAGRMIAYLGNWQACPTAEQISQYTHIVIGFAVTYTWNPSKNICDDKCVIGSPVPICNNQNRQDLVDEWRSNGKKVILSFGGAGMGGSWAGDVNDCWDHCFDKSQSVIDQLNTIVRAQHFDGIDIDFEYFYDTDEAKAFLADITVGLKTTLPPDQNIITHAPMEPDSALGTDYYALLKDNAAYLDFLMPQYYNGFTRPAVDGLTGTGAGSQAALPHYNNLVNDMFGGDATKVVFGFCISDCSGTGSNASGSQAKAVMTELKASYSCNGGAFFWVINHDSGGSWSSTVNSAIDTDQCGPGPAPTPVPPTNPPVVSPTESPVEQPTAAPVEATSAPVQPPPTPSPPSSTGLISTTTPRCGATEVEAREMCSPTCVSGADCPAGTYCWGTHPTYCASPGYTPPQWSNPSISSVTHRCGTSEVDARSFCKQACLYPADCTEPGEKCYAVHQNYCGSEVATSRMLRRGG